MDPRAFFDGHPHLPLLLSLAFAFSNGFRDSSTIVATIVSTRVLAPGFAFVLCAFFEFGGALLLGSAVAATVAGDLLRVNGAGSSFQMMMVLEAALMAALLWGIISWWRAWPTSNNHALVAGLWGAGFSVWGWEGSPNKKILTVLLVLISSPILGFLVSAFVTFLLRKGGEWFSSKIKAMFDGLHLLSCLAVSSAHGSNDGQLAMGVMMAALGGGLVMTGGSVGESGVPWEIRFYVALALATGVLFGGRRILKKLGMKFFRIRDVQGLGAEMTAATTILFCNGIGFPASTTQVIAGSIVGAGVAKNPRAVRWHVVQEILLSWVLTLPAVAFLSFILAELLQRGGGSI